MITDAVGRLDTISDASIGRIRYYNFVRQTSVLIGIVTLLLTGCYRGTRPPHVGAAAPDFTIQDTDRKVSLTDLRGKVVVLNFWASYCPPCIEETPSLEQLQKRLKDKGIVVLGVSWDADGEAYHKFLTAYKIDFPTVRDVDQKSSGLYGTLKIPETYIIDRNGIVRRKFVSAVDWSQPEIVDFLSKL
jgi:cytochrome c biogenesis protein CcmG/thiol:disulfide interchange protein DsbE